MTHKTAHSKPPANPRHADDHHLRDGHEHPRRWFGGLWEIVTHLAGPHPHDATDAIDPELETSRDGRRALLISMAVLMATFVLQAAVFARSRRPPRGPPLDD